MSAQVTMRIGAGEGEQALTREPFLPRNEVREEKVLSAVARQIHPAEPGLFLPGPPVVLREALRSGHLLARVLAP